MKNIGIKLFGKTLDLQEFDIRTMVPNPSIVMIAKRGSGKSWICRALLYKFKDIPGGVIIAPTDRMNCFYGKFFPDIYIHYKYKSDIIEKILFRQQEIIDKAARKQKKGKKIDPRAFLIMDDCLSTKTAWMKDEPIMKLMFDGRHYQITFILTMQFPLGITPELRCNFDYIFLLAEDFYSNQRRIYEHYAGMFPNFELFRQVFHQITDDYGCMVIVNRGARTNFLDKIFWYKAPNREITAIGCKQFREFHRKNYDSEWRKKSESFTLDRFVTGRRKNLAVKVSKCER